MFNEFAFKSGSETGIPVIILMPISKCDCGLNLNSEIDNIFTDVDFGNSKTTCNKCINGIIYKEIISEKIRFENFSITSSGNLEKSRIEETKKDNKHFFFSKNYFFISSDYLISEIKTDKDNKILYDENGKLTKINIYEVSDIIEMVENDFKCFKVSCKKILLR